MSRVLTMGTFDLLHPGHVHLLKVCSDIAGSNGTVTVGLNSSQFVAEFKGRPPVQSYDDRFAMLTSLRYVDEVFQTPGQDAKPLIQKVNPHFLVIGSDWAPPKDYYAQLQIDAEFLRFKGVTLLYLDRSSYHSSTELKERVRSV